MGGACALDRPPDTLAQTEGCAALSPQTPSLREHCFGGSEPVAEAPVRGAEVMPYRLAERGCPAATPVRALMRAASSVLGTRPGDCTFTPWSPLSASQTLGTSLACHLPFPFSQLPSPSSAFIVL